MTKVEELVRSITRPDVQLRIEPANRIVPTSDNIGMALCDADGSVITNSEGVFLMAYDSTAELAASALLERLEK